MPCTGASHQTVRRQSGNHGLLEGQHLSLGQGYDLGAYVGERREPQRGSEHRQTCDPDGLGMAGLEGVGSHP